MLLPLKTVDIKLQYALYKQSIGRYEYKRTLVGLAIFKGKGVDGNL